MADDNSNRSRMDDVNAPLAELARLIGQPDPYIDQARAPAAAPAGRQGAGGWRETAAALAREAMRQQSPAPAEDTSYAAPVVAQPRRTGPQGGPPALQALFTEISRTDEDFGDAPGAAAARPAYDDHRERAPAYDAHGYDARGDGAHGEEAHDELARGEEPAPRAEPRRSSALPAADHGDENYFFDDAAPRDGAAEADYDDPPRVKSSNGLVTAAVLIGCALFGTAAAYGYRTYYTGIHSGNAPIIPADNGPVKMVPPSASADSQSGKAIHDRIGDAGGERIVRHQEEPVQLGDAGTPRVVLPAPFTTMPGSGRSQSQNQVQSQVQSQGTSATSAGTAFAGLPPSESKKIHTVAIRPDGTEVTPRLSAAPPVATQNQPVQLSPPSANATFPPPPPPAAAPAPKAVATRAAPAPRGDAPLTLVPSDDAPAASPPASRERSVQPQLASVPNAAGAGAIWMVQVSSQRSEADALASYKILQAKYPQLADRPALVRRVDLGGDKGVYYRALVGPLASRADAAQLCSDLRAAGGPQCNVQSESTGR